MLEVLDFLDFEINPLQTDEIEEFHAEVLLPTYKLMPLEFEGWNANQTIAKTFSDKIQNVEIDSTIRLLCNKWFGLQKALWRISRRTKKFLKTFTVVEKKPILFLLTSWIKTWIRARDVKVSISVLVVTI